jgi:hypothetical protein
MAGIGTSIELYDGASATLDSVTKSTAQTVQGFETMANVINTLPQPKMTWDKIDLAEKFEAQTKQIENMAGDIEMVQAQINKAVSDTENRVSGLENKISGAVTGLISIATVQKTFGFIEDCTESFNTQLNAENQLMGVLANMLDKDYVTQFELQTTADTTGAVNDINAMQSSIGEVAVPVSIEKQALRAEFDSITSKASEIQSKGIYGDEAMIAAGAEFATYFKDTDAIEMMMDTLADYTMGMTGGGEVDTDSMVNYATNLGKIMTGSYDAMSKKGFEFTEAQQAIIEGEATREQVIETLGAEYADMSSDMQAAAAISQVIDESWSGLYETMSNTPEGKIIQLNNAWGDMKETIGGQLYPYIIRLIDTINQNWGSIETVVNGVTTGLGTMLTILGYLFDGAMNVANVMINNWSYIEPIIIMIVGALAAYRIALGLSTIANGAAAIATTIHNAKLALQAKMTFSATAAQYGFNAALLACPLTWIVGAVIAVIAVLYGVVGIINKVTGSTISATGIIMGAIAVVIAYIYNTLLGWLDFQLGIINRMVNGFVDFANFIANVFTSPISSIIYLFQGMGDSVLEIIESIAGALDAVFGSKLADTVSGWRDGLKGLADKAVEKYASDENYKKVVNDLNLSAESLGLTRWAYSDAWNSGYGLGKNLVEKLDALELGTMPDLGDVTATDTALADSLGEMAGGVDDIANNTEEIKNNSDIVDLIKDYHSRQATQKSTTQYVTIDMSGQTNHISKSMELSEVMDGIVNSARQAAAVMTEGV